MDIGRTTSWGGRLMGVLAALALTAGLLTVTAAPASAGDPQCSTAPLGDHRACLTIDYAGGGRWHVKVGYDGYMEEWEADSLLYNCPGGFQIFSDVWTGGRGREPARRLGYLSLVAPPASGHDPNGLFADFAGAAMDLDDLNDPQIDRVYAEVTYYNCFTGTWITHGTGVINGYF
jgi:hypothetical protein